MTEGATPSMEGDLEEALKEEDGHKVALPEDGYEWKKYGQKFIINIAKYRSYYRCQKANCPAKKRAESSTREPAGDLRVIYEGLHNHDPPMASAPGSSAGANEFDLLTQLSGKGASSSTQHHPHQY